MPKCSKRLTYNRKAPGSVPLGQLDEFICFLIASCSTYRSQSTSGHKQFQSSDVWLRLLFFSIWVGHPSSSKKGLVH